MRRAESRPLLPRRHRVILDETETAGTAEEETLPQRSRLWPDIDRRPGQPIRLGQRVIYFSAPSVPQPGMGLAAGAVACASLEVCRGFGRLMLHLGPQLYFRRDCARSLFWLEKARGAP